VNAAAALAAIAGFAAARELDMHHDPATGMGALFSRCGAFRYLLWRLPRPRAAMLGMGMLNPSRADETRDDATIARCRALAARTGSGNLLVWNLFALRARDPAMLRQAGDPLGPDNDAAIALALTLCGRTVLAWGNHGRLMGRGAEVLETAREDGRRLDCLGVTAWGEPRHPLYLRRETTLRRFKPLSA
jgi:hypothetical protein